MIFFDVFRERSRCDKNEGEHWDFNNFKEVIELDVITISPLTHVMTASRLKLNRMKVINLSLYPN